MSRPLPELLKMGEGTRACHKSNARSRQPRTSPYLTRGHGRPIGQLCRRPTCDRVIVPGARLCPYHLDQQLDKIRSGDRRYR